MWLSGAVADEINSPDTAQTHRPLNVPQRIPHHESRAPVRKHVCCCLAKSTPQLGKKQWLLAEATTGLRRCSHPHSSVIYHTTDMHAWPGASQTRHTVGIGSSCLIIALHSNAAHYLNVFLINGCHKASHGFSCNPYFQFADFISQTQGTMACK